MQLDLGLGPRDLIRVTAGTFETEGVTVDVRSNGNLEPGVTYNFISYSGATGSGVAARDFTLAPGPVEGFFLTSPGSVGLVVTGLTSTSQGPPTGL